MTTRLALYNEALLLLGERPIANLSENREPRRVLDAIWDGGLVRSVLEQGLWNFAIRTAQADYSASVEPSFGYRRAFDKPTDWVRTAGVAGDGYFNSPLTQYVDEASYWFADLDALFVRYVSDDAAYGGDLSAWPQSVVRYAAAHMAHDACERVTQSSTKAETLRKMADKRLLAARSRDAMNEPTAFPPVGGSWTAARASWGRRRDWGTGGPF
ncbi:MAG TPA: hypothetical protein VFJ13_03600 [Paracoccaceae bacterium]|nr:hypothetical protein [Paracoccaceae bacterium]